MERLSAITQNATSEFRKIENSRKVDSNKKNRIRPGKNGAFRNGSDSVQVAGSSSDNEVVKSYVVSQPEIREDKISEVREKIKNGYYDTPEFLDKLTNILITKM